MDEPSTVSSLRAPFCEGEGQQVQVRVFSLSASSTTTWPGLNDMMRLRGAASLAAESTSSSARILGREYSSFLASPLPRCYLSHYASPPAPLSPWTDFGIVQHVRSTEYLGCTPYLSRLRKSMLQGLHGLANIQQGQQSLLVSSGSRANIGLCLWGSCLLSPLRANYSVESKDMHEPCRAPRAPLAENTGRYQNPRPAKAASPHMLCSEWSRGSD